MLPGSYGSQRRIFRSVGLRLRRRARRRNWPVDLAPEGCGVLPHYARTVRSTHAAATRTDRATAMSMGIIHVSFPETKDARKPKPVADWIRLSRLGDVRSPRRCTAKFVHADALLSLAGGWLSLRTAESSRLLSFSSRKEIEMRACPAARAASGRHARRSPFACCARRIPARRVSPLFVNGLMKP